MNYENQLRKVIEFIELWIPAAMLLETAERDQQDSEFVIWRQEARYFLRWLIGFYHWKMRK